MTEFVASTDASLRSLTTIIVSVKVRHANIVNFTMFTVQANDQLSFQTVKILILMVEYAVYYYEIEPFQGFLEGFVFENRE